MNLEFSAFFEDVFQSSVDLLDLTILEVQDFLQGLAYSGNVFGNVGAFNHLLLLATTTL